MSSAPIRRILLLVHPHRPEAIEVAVEVVHRLRTEGIELVMPQGESHSDRLLEEGVRVASDPAHPAAGCELVVILGGDGTILRGAELARGSGVPLLGFNLGHVGFLAEIERDDIGRTVEHILARQWVVDERMALEVVVSAGDREVFRSWALNEVSIEKAARERMIELAVGIDGRPLSTWGCDGLVMATPTGSTAYAFSAGGPIVWPDVEALLVVPISAHALFARPVVVGPSSQLTVEVLPHTDGSAVVWCDGRRATDVPPGSPDRSGPLRRAGAARPVHHPAFADRLVRKLDLPVHGWRGPRTAR